jgi:hypothetical protein
VGHWKLAAGSPSSRSDRKPYAVLDIETDGLRGPLVYWTATCECVGGRVTAGRTAESLWRHVLVHESRTHANQDHVWWAHNGGEYDYVYLFDSAKADAARREAVVHPVMRASNMIGFRITKSGHRTDLRDSYALLPASLAALAAQLAPDLPKLDIGLHDGVTFDPADPVHVAYAERDARALLAVLVRFREIVSERFGGTLPSWSAASTALRAWQQTLDPDVSYSPGHHRADALARAGYYGGLVHPGSVALHHDVQTVDANAMYPTVMRDGGVPAGWSMPVTGYRPGRPGFYLCTVDVPRETPFTFLPYRDPVGALAWPTGRFQTVISSIELEAARARGIAVTVHSGSVWQRLDHPFGRFVDIIEAMRAEGGAMSLVGKLMGNGLYGKFGAKPTHEEWAIADERPEAAGGRPWWPAGADPDDRSMDGLWTRTGVPLRAPYLLPHWAAWITAGARLRLLGIAEAIGAASVIYTDTDSVTAPRAAIETATAAGRLSVGPAFGQVKVEATWHSYRVIASKVYRGVTMTGRRVRKAKGIPAKLRPAAFGGAVVGWKSPNAAIQVLRGATMTTDRTRRLSSIAGSLAWRAQDDGSVRPVHLGGD